MAEFKKVARVEDIPTGKVKGFEVGYDKIVICNTGEGFYAVADECSHEMLPRNRARLKGNIILCPHHGARYDVRTGEVTHPPAIVPVQTFEVKVENGEIFVKLD
ncbi:MAG: Rieske (2Fe-2S) protein [Candidatus Zixiibacteriota bacterium]